MSTCSHEGECYLFPEDFKNSKEMAHKILSVDGLEAIVLED
jgi:hypothetical protein